MEAVAVELQKRWTFVEIDHYFAACQFDHNGHPHGDYGSKRVYAQAVLSSVADSRVQAIAADLGVVQDGTFVGLGKTSANVMAMWRIYRSGPNPLSRIRRSATTQGG